MGIDQPTRILMNGLKPPLFSELPATFTMFLVYRKESLLLLCRSSGFNGFGVSVSLESSVQYLYPNLFSDDEGF